MVSMDAGTAFGYRDDSARLPSLSLGLSSVRLIVNKFESQYTRVNTDQTENRELVKYDPKIDSACEDYDDFPFDHTRGRVWHRFAQSLGFALSRCIPSVSFGNFGVLAVTTGLFAPRMISYLVLYPFCRLVFGTLYPAYASYKAVRTKNLKEYVKWMMYWIVFALFTCTETFTDVFLSWFPFYYEVKIVLVLWLLSPATKGSSILYRKFVHPALCRREQEIDEYIAKAKDQGYHTVLNLGTKGVNYATTVIMQTAIKGGGGLVQQLRKSYSLSDLSECEPRDERGNDEADDVLTEPRLIRRTPKSGFTTRRSASESNSRSPMYFPEVDVDVRPRPRSDEPDFSHIKSTEDISSGYSSADNSASLTRTASLGAAARARSRTTRTTVTTIKRPQAAEEGEVIIEELRDDDGFEYANMPPLELPSPIYLSHSDPPFLYQYIGDQIKIVQVLGNYPLSPNNDSKTGNTDPWDQKETPKVNQVTSDSVKQDNQIQNNTTDTAKPTEVVTEIIEAPKEIIEAPKEITEFNKNDDVQDKTTNDEFKETIHTGEIEPNIVETEVNQDFVDAKSIYHSQHENDSAESDDEASFGTPENSPKTKKKSPKGKYGKQKAPSPPNVDESYKEDKNNLNINTLEVHTSTKAPSPPNLNVDESNKEDNNNLNINILEVHTSTTTSQESLVDVVNRMPNIPIKESGGSKGLQVINPIVENKRRHKSKSPGRIPKGNSSSISKLLQLPSKLAFWNKTEDKSKSDTSHASSSSGDRSRRSSNVEHAIIDEFQSCVDLTTIIPNVNNMENMSQTQKVDNEFVDATDLETENIQHDIAEKSVALQKLIDEKLASHPEYKIVPLHDEIPTTSKSTDV